MHACLCSIVPLFKSIPVRLILLSVLPRSRGRLGLCVVLCSYRFHAGGHALPVDPHNAEQTQAIIIDGNLSTRSVSWLIVFVKRPCDALLHLTSEPGLIDSVMALQQCHSKC